MPLPRFHRLPAEQREAILAVAANHLARDGAAGLAVRSIVAEAGISRSSAYQYFDGKDDLVHAVGEYAVAKMRDVLGPWSPQTEPQAFWDELTAGSVRLSANVTEHPDLAAVLTQVPLAESPSDDWLQDMIRNAVNLSLIASDIDLGVLARATAAVIAAIDNWALEQSSDAADVAQLLTRLLRGLWTAPRRA